MIKENNFVTCLLLGVSNIKRIVMRLNLEFCKSFLKMTKLYLTMMFLTPDVSQEIWQAPLFEHCNKTRKLTKIALER